jgi:hypothetical protein
MTGRPVFVLHLRPEAGVDPVRGLRAVLKLAARWGLCCTAIRRRASL